MRATFSRILTEAARRDDRLLLLTGDHGYALFDEFRQNCAGQYINCGVAEQNMIGVAAGLAKAGFRPVVYGLAAFVPMRVLEQIKIDVCYESLPVIFVGDGAGLVYAQLGTSHQCTEDVAALRAVPNLDIVSPADRFELQYCWSYLLQRRTAGYLRFGKADCGDVHSAVPDAPIGDLLPICTGKADWAIVATGSMVSTATRLSRALGGVAVWSVPVVAPINRIQAQNMGRRFRGIFVLEEHSVAGGLGGLMAEAIGEVGGCRVVRFGTRQFSELCGDYKYLLSYHGLNDAALLPQMAELMAAGSASTVPQERRAHS
jgi:transketolase